MSDEQTLPDEPFDDEEEYASEMTVEHSFDDTDEEGDTDEREDTGEAQEEEYASEMTVEHSFEDTDEGGDTDERDDTGEAQKDTLTTDMVEVPDADVPFNLPHVSQLEPDPEDERNNPNKMVTMPTYRVPGDTDPKATLPGTFGLDPNPDAGHSPPSESTMKHPAVQAAQPLQQQYTMPNPNVAQPGKQAKQAYPKPPQRQNPNAPALPRRRRRRRILGLRPGCLWVILGLLVSFCGGMTLLTMVAAAIIFPPLEEQWNQVEAFDTYQSFESTFLFDRYGNELYEAFGEGRRTQVEYERFPKYLIDATIAIEDDSFFNNIGIDLGATTVAFLQYIGAGQDGQTPGGSTITQQLVRNVLFDAEKRAERSAQRKVEEIIGAIALTQRKPKEEILSLYLNEIYYGNLAYGAQTASQILFGKDVENLTLGEAALLAGLPQAPADLDPLNPDPEVQAAVDARWRQVLNEMVEEGFVTSAERDAALSQGLAYVSPNVSLLAPHFTVYAQGELERLMRELGYTPEDITRGGLRVYTTIDQNVNNLALQAAQTQVATLQRNNVSNAAVVVIKPLTGEIVGMVGSIDYNNDFIDGRVNVATAFRQPGSTMKPFTYSAAIERGMTPGDVIWDTRTEIGIPGQPLYTPRNYDGAFHGPLIMRDALANSYNIPAVQTLRIVGVDYLLNLMHRFGVSTLNEDPSQYGLSLTLGGGEVSLLELTNAFAVFANQGSFVQVTSILCIVDSNDNIIYQYENSCPAGRVTATTVERVGFGTQVLDPRIAFLMSDILSDNNARSTAMGANSPLRTDGIASSVKTGTTNDVKDNWTIGYTRNIAIGVWVGNNNGDPMVNSSGLTGAAPIWNSVINAVYNNGAMLNAFAVGGQLLPDQPATPPGMTLRSICDIRRLSDPSTGCSAHRNEWFLDGPAGIPDADGNLNFPQPQQQAAQFSSHVQLISPGVYQTVVYPIPPEVAAGIQFQINTGDKTPLPPKYCIIPPDLQPLAPAPQQLVFIGAPTTSQPDAVEAERYARERGLAFLPTIECWAEVFTIQAQNFGPAVVDAVITSPANGEVVTGNMPILGTANFTHDLAQFYKLEIHGPPFPDWTTLGNTHPDSVINGQLEWLAAEGLPPGTYQLRLALVDNNAGFLQQPYTITFIKQ